MASLTKIHIQNFRIHKDTNIFAGEKNIGNLLVLVGKNDIGKTSVLKALDVFFNEQEVTSNDFYQENEEDIVLGCQIENKVIRKVFKRNGNDDTIANETELPIYLYFDISNQSVFSEIEEYTIDDIMFIVENQIKRYIKYNMDYDQDYINECYQDIPIEDYAEELLYKWKELLEDFNQNGKHIPISHRGAGVKKVCALYYHIMQSMMRTNEIDYVFAIDEPELSLHPAQQRKMMQILKRISEKKEWENIQIIIATHSPYIVNEVNTKDIFILKHKVDANGNALPEIEPHPLDASVLKTYNSLAEINYIAFDLASEEFHQELYGQIEIEWLGKSNGSIIDQPIYKLQDYKCENRDKTFGEIVKTLIDNYNNANNSHIDLLANEFVSPDKGKEPSRCFCHCVRNSIDHPCEGNVKWKEYGLIDLSIKILLEINNCFSDIKKTFFEKIKDKTNLGKLPDRFVDEEGDIKKDMHLREILNAVNLLNNYADKRPHNP